MMRIGSSALWAGSLLLMAGACSNRPKPQPLRQPEKKPGAAVESIEKGKDVNTSEESPKAESGPVIEEKTFGGHRYKMVVKKISWHDARKECEAAGGMLVCIETKEEQAFIARWANNRYLYLGATDEDEEDTWKWINGAPFEYTAWMDGQPNNYGEEEHYLATYDDGEWVDVAAEGGGFWMPTGYICEMTEKAGVEKK